MPSLDQLADGRVSTDKNRRVGYVQRSDSGKMIYSVFAVGKNGPKLGSWLMNLKT